MRGRPPSTIREAMTSRTPGLDGRLASNKMGYAILRRKYDERDRPVEEEHFSPDGKPVLGAEGFARVVRRYDTRGKEIRREYFGAEGEPVPVNGVSKIVGRYDAHGRLVERSSFGVDGSPIEQGDNAARETYTYCPESFELGVESFEFDAGVVGGELPVGFHGFGVSFPGPGRDLGGQAFDVGDAPIEALAGEDR